MSERNGQCPSYIDNQDERLRKLESIVGSLKSDVKHMKDDRDAAVEAKEKAQQEVLLGQVAYTMAQIAESYVYGASGSESLVPLSLCELDERAMSMTEEQLGKWNTFKAVVSDKVNFSTALAADKYLRWFRRSPAHGTTKQARQTTASDLKLWASMRCSAKAMETVQAYIDVLNFFSRDDYPLVVQQEHVRSILN